MKVGGGAAGRGGEWVDGEDMSVCGRGSSREGKGRAAAVELKERSQPRRSAELKLWGVRLSVIWPRRRSDGRVPGVGSTQRSKENIGVQYLKYLCFFQLLSVSWLCTHR